ncbi:MAG TPA: hypothetical protein VFH73_16795, partial [Polyangia bacterium]|nr:hypothetical protein [Polyangia bacterium]
MAKGKRPAARRKSGGATAASRARATLTLARPTPAHVVTAPATVAPVAQVQPSAVDPQGLAYIRNQYAVHNVLGPRPQLAFW